MFQVLFYRNVFHNKQITKQFTPFLPRKARTQIKCKHRPKFTRKSHIYPSPHEPPIISHPSPASSATPSKRTNPKLRRTPRLAHRTTETTSGGKIYKGIRPPTFRRGHPFSSPYPNAPRRLKLENVEKTGRTRSERGTRTSRRGKNYVVKLTRARRLASSDYYLGRS